MHLRTWLLASKGWLLVIALPLVAALALAPVVGAAPTDSEEDGSVEAPVKAKTESAELRIAARERIRTDHSVQVLRARVHRAITRVGAHPAPPPLAGRPAVPLPLLC